MNNTQILLIIAKLALLEFASKGKKKKIYMNIKKVAMTLHGKNTPDNEHWIDLQIMAEEGV